MIITTWIDEWMPNKQHVNYTDLTEKERKTHRYHRHQSVVRERQLRSSRTRPSDIAPRRITDGIPAGHTKQVFSYAPRKPTPFDLLLEKLTTKKESA